MFLCGLFTSYRKLLLFDHSLVLGVSLIYYSKKLARLRANESTLFTRIIAACQCKGAQWSHFRLPVHIYISRTLTSERSTSCKAASCAPPYRHYYPLLRQTYKGMTNSDFARGIAAWYEAQLTAYSSLFTTVFPNHGVSGESRIDHLGLSPLPSITTMSASCHRRFCLLFYR